MKPFSALSTIIDDVKAYTPDNSEARGKVFFRLLWLYLKSKFGRKDKPATARIAGFDVEGFDYPTLINLYKEIFLRKVYDFNTTEVNPFIVDGGAHVGMAVFFFKMKYPNAAIAAFEPNPLLFAVLKRNVAKNKLTGVTLYDAALSGNERSADFYIPAKTGSLNGSLTQNKNTHKMVSVRVRKLSDFINHRSVALVKLDIEGEEHNVVGDLVASGSLVNVRQLVIEYHYIGEDAKNRVSLFLSLLTANHFEHTLRFTDDPAGATQNMIFHFFPSPGRKVGSGGC